MQTEGLLSHSGFTAELPGEKKKKKPFAVALFTKATKTMFGAHSWTRKLL